MSPEALELASVKYLQETKELNNRLPDLQAEFARFDSRGELFTSWMKTSQALPFSKKAPFYKKWRLDDQIGWYSDRAKSNSEREALWFTIIFCIEFVAIVFSILQACQLMRFNPVSGVAAIGAASIAWFQTKRFSDLGTSYAIAATDLQLIKDSHASINDEVELAQLVSEVETAVSREHSMWLARRLSIHRR
jgi:hypothetical protein